MDSLCFWFLTIFVFVSETRAGYVQPVPDVSCCGADECLGTVVDCRHN